MFASVGGSFPRWQVRGDQTRTSLTAGLTLLSAVGLSVLRPYYRLGRNLFPVSKEMRSLDAGSDREKANCSRVSLKSVHIGKVIPKSHDVNHFDSNLALLRF